MESLNANDSLPEQEEKHVTSSDLGQESNILEKNATTGQFKKPLIVGPQRGKANTHQSKSCKIIQDIHTDANRVDTPEEKNSERKEKIGVIDRVDKGSLLKQPPSLPYKEPEWCGYPSSDYKLEEVKSGTIVRVIELSSRSCSVFGRLENCDIPMLHPTVSRYHAVLQYRAVKDDNNESGFYIYDLGSSLGTFLNKIKIKPKTYIRVRVGHILKIGCSTRMFILQGPEEDEEPESDLTITELKQQHQEKLAAIEAERARLEAEEEERLKKEEERGIDWGMGEDADEETDLTENPYASTLNEELFLDDPKKTLRGWFEREGEELVYDVEEKGFGHFICRIELPVDNGGGGNLVAEASVKGKKKEAVVQAALEACRLLDRQGLLRQATHESKKRAAKDWEANDYYDSDEDNFLDRTGQIEKKRQKRMAQSGKLETEIETYDTLREKYRKVIGDIEASENRLNNMLNLATQTSRSGDGEGEDELDAFMSTLNYVPADKIEIKKMKDEIARLKKEEGKLRKLVNLTRPTELPKLEPFVVKKNERKVELPQGSIGKKSTKRKQGPQIESLPLATTQQTSTADSVEEFDEEEEEEKNKNIKESSNQREEQQKNQVEVIKKKSRPDNRNRQKKKLQPLKQVNDEEYSNCTWTPPAGQTGDGRTSLNDKLGY